MRRRGPMTLALVVGLWLIPGVVRAQETERAVELEARQAERLRAREAQRPAPTTPSPPWRSDPYGYGPAPWAPYGYGGVGFDAGVAGPFPYGWPGFDPFGMGPELGGYGPRGYFDPFGYRPGRAPMVRLPNPYGDWAHLWGRGWLDDAAVPPYHRFQYRFFPQTLPDPTRGGYVRPGGWLGGDPYGPVPPTAGAACARIELSLGAETPEVILVRLPALGAGSPASLQAAITDRLRRGAGVVLRDVQGYVVQLPALESVQSLTVSGCR